MITDVKRLDERRVLYDEHRRRYTDEKFIVTVNNGEAQIECSGDKSEFYARNYLSRNTHENGEYVISPSFKIRGYIEGFYGKPWSTGQRLSALSLMAKHGMNTYFYAPKDDPYHRERWRELYPEKELSELKTLIREAKKNYVDFVWCIAPGLDIVYSSDVDFSLLTRKVKQLYDCGVRSFGLLLDDISDDLFYYEDKTLYKETVNAHIYLIERLNDHLKKTDSFIRLTVCPTLYHGKGDEYYISKLSSRIDPQISLFWTGRDICSRELTTSDAIKFYENTRRKPLFWDNYPVNDMAMHFEMHLGPLIGRECDLYKYCEGIIFNCMEYAECSKIPLITAADYLWDSEAYDPEASWKKALNEVIGTEYAESFAVFADHLRTSCLMDENSKYMKELFLGNFTKSEIEQYLQKLDEAKAFLRSDAPICDELKRWSDKFFIACEIINLIAEYNSVEDESLKEGIIKLINNYNSIPEKLTDDSDFLEIIDYLSRKK